MSPDDQPVQYHRTLPRNRSGRDFCVGDVHGVFHLLERALEAIDFDPERDRLISVGDLIDRGPHSTRVLEFLAHPWFYAVRGNHEAMLLDNVNVEETDIRWLVQAGAEWWLTLTDEARAVYPGPLSQLPYTIEVDTADGRVGIVHADIPQGYDWDSFVSRLPHDPYLREHALWARTRINQIQRGTPPGPIPGLHLLVVGHTPVSAPLNVQNIYFVDTGAAYSPQFAEAALTLLQIHPQQHVFSFPAA